MLVITVPYTLVWQLDFDNNYGWTKCGKCFNIKRQKELKQVMQGGSIGYNIKGKFYTLKKLKQHLTKIPKRQWIY